MNLHVSFVTVFFVCFIAYIIRELYLKDIRQSQREKYLPYDLLLLTNGEVASLLTWCDEHFICQLSDGNIEYKRWKLLKENVTYDKRCVIINCETNLKRLNIPLPIAAKKVNTLDDTVAKIVKRNVGTDVSVSSTDVENKTYLDSLNEEQLEKLKIYLEEQGEYEKLSLLRDYMIIRFE